MPDEAEQPIPKRRRVTVACDSCRSKKSKCDGRRPQCGRCIGYGFTCTWVAGQRDHDRLAQGGRRTSFKAPSNQARSSCGSFQECQVLVRQLSENLSDVARAEVEESLARIQTHLDETTSPAPATNSPGNGAFSSQNHGQRYLGEVSDVHFFNLAKRTLGAGDLGASQSPEIVEENVESYDQEEAIPTRQMEYELSAMPDLDKAEQYLEAYFSTIHIAYPFVPKASFMERYRSLRLEGNVDNLTPSWLGLLYAIFAIGAYYISFPRDEERKEPAEVAHLKYFFRSRHLSGFDILERSVTQVSTLLAQCFYSLATSRIDRCWITLGLAIRLAQSVGLHVELPTVESDRDVGQSESETQETRRRVWYSLYVLDRLIALQLGRPPAIFDEDCYVSLPSRKDDSMQDGGDASPATVGSTETRSVGEYFVRVIEFSSILGRVLRALCNPHHKIVDKLQATARLDGFILAWKQKLPRYLRFDIGHAFEKSVTFKRQRNLLAIKFHHIRALIHRPFLGSSRAGSLPEDLAVKEQYSLMQGYEQVCISEAQKTARLLHNVRDEQELIHDYPWWQMVSCLVCAGSILIVAENIFKQRADPSTDATILGEDAETCLGIFQALSHNSRGAKVAMDMLRKLREQTSLQMRNATPGTLNDSITVHSPVALPSVAQQSCPVPNPPAGDVHRPWPTPSIWYAENYGAGPSAGGQTELPWGGSEQSVGLWPLEIEDSMAWSTNLFNMLQQEDVPIEYPPPDE